MGAQQRVYRRRIKTVQSTKKITKAMELIAASRIAKAQQAVNAARPYEREITRVLSALASQSTIDHPLVNEKPNPSRAAVYLRRFLREFPKSPLAGQVQQELRRLEG